MTILIITMEALADKRRELEQVTRSMVSRIRQRAGCNDISWYQDMENDRYCLFSIWHDRESLENYLQSDQFSALLGTKILLKSPHSIQIYDVRGREGSEAVEAMRIRNKNKVLE